MARPKAIVEEAEKIEGLDYEELKEGPYAGKFLLQVEKVGDYALEDVGGLKRGIQAERKAANESGPELKRMKELLGDRDLSEAVAALDRLAELDGDLTKDERFQQAVESRSGAQIKKLTAERDEALTASVAHREQADSLFKWKQLAPHIVKAGGDLDLVIDRAMAMSRVEYGKDGSRSLVILDDDGSTPRMTEKSGSTDNMGPEEFVTSVLRERHPKVFEGYGEEGTGAAGEGDSPPAGVGRRPAREPRQRQTVKSNLTREQLRDPAAYRRMKEEAQKQGVGVNIPAEETSQRE